MGKLPAIWLYPGDWLQDEIAGCSLAAQGLLLRMMFIGHSSTRYGYLVNSDGAAIPSESIARRCGCTPEQYATLLIELDNVGKLNRTPENVIFIKRMVRDAAAREKGKNRVIKHRLKRSCNGDVTPIEDEIESEVKPEVILKKALEEERFVLPVWMPEIAWLAYLQMRHKKRADPTENAKRLICKKLEKWMNQGQSVEEILYQSVTSSWTDVYELKESYGAGQNNSRGRQSAGQARTERTRNILTETLRERHGDSAMAGPDLPADADRNHQRGTGPLLVRGTERPTNSGD